MSSPRPLPTAIPSNGTTYSDGGFPMSFVVAAFVVAVGLMFVAFLIGLRLAGYAIVVAP